MTVILPPDDVWTAPVFAGPHRLNGNGEMTGLEWVRECGMLTTPIALTNTHSVGVVRDALLAERLTPGGAVAAAALGASRCRRNLGRAAQRPQRLPCAAGARP